MTINESDKDGIQNRFSGTCFAHADESSPSCLKKVKGEKVDGESESEQKQQCRLESWIAQLNSSRPAEFFCDMPRPITLSGRVDMQNLQIKGDLYNKIQRYCKDFNVSPFDVLLAAFRAAHYRLTGAGDVTIGVPKGIYGAADSGDVVDLLAKIRCFRLITENDESFEDLVHQVETIVADIKGIQDVLGEKIAAGLHPQTEKFRQPLIRVTFSVYFQDIETKEISTDHEADLNFRIFDIRNIMECCIVFSTDLYEKRTVNGILTIFQKILEAGLAEPTVPINTIPLLGHGELKVLKEMGLLRIQKTNYPRELSVIDVFRQQVLASPDRVAIKDKYGSLTYAQLDERSDKVALWLWRQSLAPEALVGVLSPRCSLAVVAIMGILKANMAYLPLDPKTPSYRMKTILSSIADRKIIMLGPEVEVSIDLNGIEYIRISQAIDDAMQEGGGPHELIDRIPPSATSLAYVMFTSGSTGQPKGVMIEHRGIVRLVKQSNHMAHLPPAGIMAHMINIAFDAVNLEIYSALLNGGQLVCIDEMTVLDYASMSKTFIRENIQSAVFPAAIFKEYVRNAPEILAHLQMLFVGGERLDPNDVSAAFRVMPGSIINSYGPTENTTASTMYCITDAEKCINGVPIGHAISNSGAVVMDSQQRLVPLGVIGELVVTGDGLARGYLNRKLDDGRFVSITVGHESVRGYRTGDYVRQRPVDGQLEFIGRIDGQAKVSGHRVELGEVEHVMRSHKLVDNAVAVLDHGDMDGDIGNACIASFVTIQDGAAACDEKDQDKVSLWDEQYDADRYAGLENIQPEAYGRDFIGWTSMFDEKDINKTEMNEWLDDTITTLLNGGHPGHVFEVGSGSGMILLNILEGLQSYVGLDPSERALGLIRKLSDVLPELEGKVSMYKATAADVGQLYKVVAAPDLVILNSVAQYIPSHEHLYKFVEDVLQLGQEMTIFFGDIRSYALYKDFLAERALRMVGEEAKLDTIRRMVRDMESAESELLVDPAFFTGLALRLPDRIEHVEIIPKTMHATNELSCYRYAAVVHVKAGSPQATYTTTKRHIYHINQNDWIDFMDQGLDRGSLLCLLRASADSSTVAISNIPHTKTIFARHVVELMNTRSNNAIDDNWLTRVGQTCRACPNLSVTDLHALADEAGYSVEVSWARQYSQRGGFDAVFHQYSSERKGRRVFFNFPTDHENRPYHSLSSHPLKYQIRQRTQEQLYELARTQLPQYMIPQAIIVIDKIPVNQNGKVDRQALVRSMPIQRLTRAATQPTTETEIKMQLIWADVLNTVPKSIGLDDSFFHIGGTSIAATKVVAEARRAGYELAVADIFRNPKLGDLVSKSCRRVTFTKGIKTIEPFELLKQVDVASFVREASGQCQLHHTNILDAYPCTPLQEGLLALTSKRQGDYVMQAVFDIEPGVVVEKLRQAWEAVVRTTPIMRTRLVQHGDLGIMQVVLDESISWTEAMGLDEYLEAVQKIPMGIGLPLTTYALVSDNLGIPKWVVCTMHHALLDGWSFSLIMDTIKKAYRDERIEPGIQFQAFIKYIKEQDETAMAAYWETYLKDYDGVPFPALPPSITEARTDTLIECTIPHPQSRSGITPSTLIRAAWALVAGRMANTKDVVFGATVAGRNAPVVGIDRMAAPTFATVPIRVKFSDTQRVSAYLNAVQQQATDMIPFEQIGLPRISDTSLGAKAAVMFQTILIIQPEETNSMRGVLAKKNHKDRYKTQQSDPYGISLELQLDQKEILVSAVFDSSVIEPWIVDRLLSQLRRAMHQLDCASLGQILSEVDLTTPEDLKQIWKWNAAVPSSVERFIHDVIEDKATQSPTADAICSWDGTLTYGELSRLSTTLAAHLISLGVGLNMTIPLFFEKSMWTTVATLGVLKTGAAFALLDQALPEERLRVILRKISTKLILSSEVLQGLSSKLANRVLAIGPEFFANVSKESHYLPPSPPLSSPMYVVFTSGSTGTPKGVITSHAAFSSAVHYQSKALGYDYSVRAYDFSGYAFDVSIGTMFMTLASGGCLCVPSDADRKNNLTSSLVATRANHIDLTPSVARTLQRERLVDLKVLILGGEAADQPDFQGIVTWITDPDNSQRLSPVGAIGELVLEGPLVGLGYFGEPEKTESVFIDDPIWLISSASGYHGRRGRLYKTGDLVRYSSDGSLTFMGRKDTQVKIRGQRVELGEVETRLRASVPNLRDVAVEVITPRGEVSNDRLVAFISFDEYRNVEENGYTNELTSDFKASLNARLVGLPGQVEDVLSASLPAYMIPTTYFAVDQIPTTTSGKTDRRLLRQIGSSFTTTQLAKQCSILSDLRRGPDTEMEQVLHRIWAQVLGIEPHVIGVNDSFFRLGGDSILAMKISAVARAEGINISTGDIFQEKTIVNLAAAPRVQASKHGSSSSPTFSPQNLILSLYSRLLPHLQIPNVDSVEDVLPCIAIQERMLAAQAKNPNVYVTGLGLEIRAVSNKSVRFQRIQTAWKAVVRRHSLMRAVFVREAPGIGGSILVVLKDPVPGISLLQQDFRGSASSKQLMDASYSDSGLQHHLSVYQIDETRAYLRFEFNHALADGQAIDMLIRDFQLAYDDRLEPHCPPYSEFLKYVTEQPYEQGRYHWTSYMGGIEPCFLPASTQAASDKRRTFSIDVTGLNTEKIAKFCAEREITTANVLQVAWAVVLRHRTGSQAPCFGNIVSARDIPIDGVNEMMGPLFYLMPSRIQLADGHTVLNILKGAHEDFVQNVRHQSYSVTQLWQDLRASCSDKMFNTALSIARYTEELPETSDGHTFAVQDKFDPVEYAVYIRGALSGESVSISLEFWEEHTSREDGEKMVTELGKTISLVVSHPEWDIRSLIEEVSNRSI